MPFIFMGKEMKTEEDFAEMFTVLEKMIGKESLQKHCEDFVKNVFNKAGCGNYVNKKGGAIE